MSNDGFLRKILMRNKYVTIYFMTTLALKRVARRDKKNKNIIID